MAKKQSPKETAIITSDQYLKKLETLKEQVAVGATDSELQLFAEVCAMSGLSPFARQIVFVKRKVKQGQSYKEVASFQTTIDGYRTIAERTGLYAGNDDYKFDEGLSEYEHIQTERKLPTTATSTVRKLVNNTIVEFTATARWEEYFPGEKQGFMWKKMPYLMLGKCAEALALRKAFPSDLSGLYTDTEMEGAANENIKGSTKVPAKAKKILAELKAAKDRDEFNRSYTKHKSDIEKAKKNHQQFEIDYNEILDTKKNEFKK